MLTQLAAVRPAALSDRDQSTSPVRLPLWELAVTIALLVLALPLMAIVWALVRLTSAGPAIYTQSRSGLHGRVFSLHKFRSMTHRCEDQTGPVWATRLDSRITPLGKLLRKTHLDELPQLFNVLRGEMSLVGPRPERPEIIARLVPEIPEYLQRLEVRPGVTGLSQLFLDSDLSLDDVRRKVRVDRHYIATRTVWLDLRIIACTALKVIGMNRPAIREILFPRAYAFVAAMNHEPVVNRD